MTKPPSLLSVSTVVPMSQDQAEICAQLISGELLSAAPFDLDMEHVDDELSRDLTFCVMTRRLHDMAPQTRVTLEALLMTRILSDSPGHGVLWAYTIHELYQREQQTVTLQRLCQVFSSGFPTSTTSRMVWLQQKRSMTKPPESDNLLDLKETWAV